MTLALGLATLLALYVCDLVIQPFIPTLAIALAIAVSTYKPYRWLLQHLQSERLAAAIAVTLVASIVIIPLALLIAYITQPHRASGREYLGTIARSYC